MKGKEWKEKERKGRTGKKRKKKEKKGMVRNGKCRMMDDGSKGNLITMHCIEGHYIE